MGGISPGSPLSPEDLLVRSLSHDLVKVGISHAGSWQTTEDEMAGWHHRLDGHELE